jgi:ATP-dependent Clp protease ATP-binding subunit ClpB
LQREHLRTIVGLELERLNARLQDRRITVHCGSEAREALIDLIDVNTYGARLVRRVVQREVTDPIATGLLTGEYHEGDEVSVDATNGALHFARRAVN